MAFTVTFKHLQEMQGSWAEPAFDGRGCDGPLLVCWPVLILCFVEGCLEGASGRPMDFRYGALKPAGFRHRSLSHPRLLDAVDTSGLPLHPGHATKPCHDVFDLF